MGGPGNEMAAGAGDRGHLRASHADREQVIGTLKAAFVQGMLTRDELGTRVGQTLAARTYADLAALTADLPAGLAAARPARPPAPVRRHPLARAAAGSGGCLGIAAAAIWAASLAASGPPGPNPYGAWPFPLLVVALFAVLTALGFFGFGVAASLEQRRSRGQLPPRPGPGGHALDAGQRDSTGHGPVPPARGSGTGQARTDLRAHKPPQRIPVRAARTPRGVRPVRGALVPRAT
jgi:Domain of unknown function (DUF1707)